METLKKALIVYIASAFIFVVLGICFIAWPQTSILVICYTIGAAILILGIVRLSQFLKNKDNNKTVAFQLNLVVGLFFIIAGGLLIIFPRVIMPVFPIIIGISVTADGLQKIKVALDARTMGHDKWGMIVVASLITIVFGLTLIFNSAQITTGIILLVGITLLVDGIQNIITIVSTFRLMSTLVLKEDAINAEFKEEDIPDSPNQDVQTEEIKPEDMIIEDNDED